MLACLSTIDRGWSHVGLHGDVACDENSTAFQGESEMRSSHDQVLPSCAVFMLPTVNTFVGFLHLEGTRSSPRLYTWVKHVLWFIPSFMNCILYNSFKYRRKKSN